MIYMGDKNHRKRNQIVDLLECLDFIMKPWDKGKTKSMAANVTFLKLNLLVLLSPTLGGM